MLRQQSLCGGKTQQLQMARQAGKGNTSKSVICIAARDLLQPE